MQATIEGVMSVEQIAGHIREFYTEGNVGFIGWRVVLYEQGNAHTAKIGAGDSSWIKQYGVTLSRDEAMRYFPEILRQPDFVYVGESAVELTNDEQST